MFLWFELLRKSIVISVVCGSVFNISSDISCWEVANRSLSFGALTLTFWCDLWWSEAKTHRSASNFSFSRSFSSSSLSVTSGHSTSESAPDSGTDTLEQHMVTGGSCFVNMWWGKYYESGYDDDWSWSWWFSDLPDFGQNPSNRWVVAHDNISARLVRLIIYFYLNLFVWGLKCAETLKVTVR